METVIIAPLPDTNVAETAVNDLLPQLRRAFIGLDTRYPLADGSTRRRIYLDSSASTLMMEPAYEAARHYLGHYANTHTTVHTAAKITAHTMRWASDTTLKFLGADPQHYLATFLGSGATAAANRAAAGLAQLRPERDVVLISSMEHHSNDLPHRRHSKTVEHIPLQGGGPHPGTVDLDALSALLHKHAGRVNYVAITGVSNVTGIINPLKEIAALAHQHDAYLLVDGAQMSAHAPANLSANDIDLYLFSGHKVYAPGSPGVLVARRALIDAMSPHEVGGGMVAAVSKWGYDLAESADEREQAGTPNILGTITLACALESLQRADMVRIFDEERTLLRWARDQLRQCPNLTLYGDEDQHDRVGAIAFNLDGIGHGLVAAILNDYHAIAVRNECFCAHPYVQEMLSEEFAEIDIDGLDNDAVNRLFQDRRGMVRASFGLYTCREDITALVNALKDIETNIEHYRPHYRACPDGRYEHLSFRPDPATLFDIEETLARQLDALRTSAQR